MIRLILGIIIGCILATAVLYFLPTAINPVKKNADIKIIDSITNKISVTNETLYVYQETNKIYISTTNKIKIADTNVTEITNLTFIDITNYITKYRDIENTTDIENKATYISGLYGGVGIIGETPIGSVSYQAGNFMLTGIAGYDFKTGGIKVGAIVSIKF